MINIRLDDDFKLTTDERNYILQRIKISEKTKEEYVDSSFYYGGLEAALNGYTEKTIKLSNATTLNSLLEEVVKVKRYIKALVVMDA